MKELLLKREQLAADILLIVEAFEAETELCVSSIELQHCEIIGRRRPQTQAATPIVLI